MMWLVWCTAIVGALAFSAAGYLFGARSGRKARRSLEESFQQAQTSIARLQAELGGADAKAAATVRAEAALADQRAKDAAERQTKALYAENAGYKTQIAKLEGLVEELRKQTQEGTAKQLEAMMRPLLKKGDQGVDQLRSELQTLAKSLSDNKSSRDAEVQAFRRQMTELLSPMLERERLNRELSQIETGSGSLGELPRFLESIASKGGFDALVLSDEAGLPLAANRGANGVDELSGISAMFLALADRVAVQGPSVPTALVIRDQSDQMAIHRIFRAGAARFLLSGTTRAMNLSPSALDPALGKLERLLLPQAVA